MLVTAVAGRPVPDWIIRDGTVAGLAEKIGVRAAGLEATIARFNAQARAGVDPDPHDFGAWQNLIESQRLDADLGIDGGDGLLQERLWEILTGGGSCSRCPGSGSAVTSGRC